MEISGPHVLRAPTVFVNAPGWDRTSNLRFRKPTLYPIETTRAGEINKQTSARIVGR